MGQVTYGHPPSHSCRGLSGPIGPQSPGGPAEEAFSPLSLFPKRPLRGNFSEISWQGYE